MKVYALFCPGFILLDLMSVYTVTKSPKQMNSF